MTLDPEGNLWFSNVTRADHSEGFTYSCAATSVFRYRFFLIKFYNLLCIKSQFSK